MNGRMRRRILHIIGGGGYGGREKMFHALLTQERQRADVESSAFLLEAEGRLADLLRGSGLTVYHMSSLPKSSWCFHGAVLFSHFDIIVCHTAEWRLMLMSILAGPPIVFRLSGLYLLVNKSMWRILLGVCRKAVGLKSTTHPMAAPGPSKEGYVRLMPPFRSLIRLLRRWQFILFLRLFCQRVIVNSHYSARNVRLKYYFPRHKKIDIIPNGISTRRALTTINDIRPVYGLRPDHFVVGTVARFDVRKRIDRLLDGFLAVKGDDKFRLLIVGDGDTELAKRFEKFVQENGLNGQVVFAGFQTETTMFMEAMNLFVLPSDNESFPNALMEAMLVGKPCVAFRGSGGPEELIQEGVTGFLVSRPDEIMDVAKKLEADSNLANEMAIRARDFIMNNYSMEQYAMQFDRVYRTVLT